jgi:hypothetical protein
MFRQCADGYVKAHRALTALSRDNCTPSMLRTQAARRRLRRPGSGPANASVGTLATDLPAMIADTLRSLSKA